MISAKQIAIALCYSAATTHDGQADAQLVRIALPMGGGFENAHPFMQHDHLGGQIPPEFMHLINALERPQVPSTAEEAIIAAALGGGQPGIRGGRLRGAAPQVKKTSIPIHSDPLMDMLLKTGMMSLGDDARREVHPELLKKHGDPHHDEHVGDGDNKTDGQVALKDAAALKKAEEHPHKEAEDDMANLLAEMFHGAGHGPVQQDPMEAMLSEMMGGGRRQDPMEAMLNEIMGGGRPQVVVRRMPQVQVVEETINVPGGGIVRVRKSVDSSNGGGHVEEAMGHDHAMDHIMQHIFRQLPPEISKDMFDELMHHETSDIADQQAKKAAQSGRPLECLILSINREPEEHLVDMWTEKGYRVKTKIYKTVKEFLEDEYNYEFEARFHKIIEINVLRELLHDLEEMDKNTAMYEHEKGNTATKITTFWYKLIAWLAEHDIDRRGTAVEHDDSHIVSLNNMDAKVAAEMLKATNAPVKVESVQTCGDTGVSAITVTPKHHEL